jgi:hypothetical protein
MNEKRAYIKKAFQMYVTHKQQIFAWEQELKQLPIPGESGVDYSHESVASSNANGVEAQFANYAERVAELTKKIDTVKKQVELVRRTIEHFKVESRAKGKNHYKYICERWLQRQSFRRAAIECGIAESTAIFWIEEIYTIAEAIAETYELL